MTVVVPEVEALQVPIDGHPQVEHDPLAGQLQRPGLHILGRERTAENRQVDRREPVEPRQLTDCNVTIDRNLDQVRLRELRTGAGDDGREGDDDVAPIRPQVCSRRMSRAS